MKASTAVSSQKDVSFGRRTRRRKPQDAPTPEVEAVVAQAAAQRLAASPVFADVPKTRLARLARGAVLKRLRAGEQLWQAGQAAQYVVLVDSGLISLGHANSEGENYSYGLFGPNEIIGLFAALEAGVYPTDATAVNSSVVVIKIDAQALTEAMGRDPAIGVAVNRALMQYAGVLRAKIEIVSAGSVPKRMAALMLYLVSRFGTVYDERQAHLPLPLTREQIGELVGARFETVIRTISRWGKAGWFRTTSEGFELLRLDMLRRVLER